MKRLTAAAALILCAASVLFADTFGNTNTEATEGYFDVPVCTRFTAPASGDITKITLHIGTFNSADSFRTAIYSDSSSNPSSKLAESGSATSVTGTGAYDSTISLAITNGTLYYLCFWSAGSSLIAARFKTPGDVSNQSNYSTGQTYPTWPSPWTNANQLDRTYSVYATYTPSASSHNLSLLGVGK